MRIPDRLADFLYRRSLPKVRDDSRLYAAHGDNHWGCSVSYRDSRELFGLFGAPLGSSLRVSGHINPRPRDGDRLLVRMESGQWAVFVLKDVELCRDPEDMFFAVGRGPLYAADELETPRTNYANEFISNSWPLTPRAPRPGPYPKVSLRP